MRNDIAETATAIRRATNDRDWLNALISQMLRATHRAPIGRMRRSYLIYHDLAAGKSQLAQTRLRELTRGQFSDRADMCV